MYESPITQIISDISSQIVKDQEDHLMCEVRQSIGYDIDKEELLKALQYDRYQYDKGFKDGQKEILDRLKDIIINNGFSRSIEGEEYFGGKTKMFFINLSYLKELFGYDCTECPFYQCPDCINECNKCEKKGCSNE